MLAWVQRDGSRPRVIGHRGGRGPDWADENTLDAFARAVAEGADGIELDVHVTSDDQIVVFHDDDLARMTNGADTRRIRDLTRRELAEVRLARGGRIPLLADVLAWADGRTLVNVEIKRPSDVAMQEEELTRTAIEAPKRTPRSPTTSRRTNDPTHPRSFLIATFSDGLDGLRSEFSTFIASVPAPAHCGCTISLMRHARNPTLAYVVDFDDSHDVIMATRELSEDELAQRTFVLASV